MDIDDAKDGPEPTVIHGPRDRLIGGVTYRVESDQYGSFVIQASSDNGLNVSGRIIQGACVGVTSPAAGADVLLVKHLCTFTLVTDERKGFLDIVFDGPPGQVGGRFIDCEVDGKSVTVGDWVESLDDGLWRLRLPFKPFDV